MSTLRKEKANKRCHYDRVNLNRRLNTSKTIFKNEKQRKDNE